MNENRGLIHLYCGDGKGKTTAAMGLALRALGQKKSVTIVQFLKDGQSGELQGLEMLGATVISGEKGQKFFSQMTETEIEECKKDCKKKISIACEMKADVLILDEVCAAVNHGLLSEKELKGRILERPSFQEVVLTGRNPADWMIDLADYMTEMKCHRHPYEKQIKARKGIEY